MKTTNRFFLAMAIMLLLFSSSVIFAQDEAESPAYISVTKMFWNKNYDSSIDEWKAVEKEYMDKVTKKNAHITGAWYYTHLLTDNSNEVLYVQSYSNWEAMGKARVRNVELEKEAWADEAARKAFLKKLNAAFSSFHSDEIYVTIDGAKPIANAPTEDMVMYIRQNKMAFPEDGTEKEFMALYKKIQENVIHKNENIKGYYPSIHAWGSDRRDFNEAILIESLGDLEKLFDRNKELMKEALTEDESKALGKYFEYHGDYIYTAVKL